MELTQNTVQAHRHRYRNSKQILNSYYQSVMNNRHHVLMLCNFCNHTNIYTLAKI